MHSTEGGLAMMSWAQSKLVSEVQEKQDQCPIFLELKENVHNQKVMTSEQGGDSVFRHQGLLCEERMDELKERICNTLNMP